MNKEMVVIDGVEFYSIGAIKERLNNAFTGPFDGQCSAPVKTARRGRPPKAKKEEVPQEKE